MEDAVICPWCRPWGSSDIYDVSIYTAGGTLYETFDSTIADTFGTLSAYTGGVVLEFANHSNGSDLYLTFAAGFDGVGSVDISESATLGSNYYDQLQQQR